MAVLIILGVLFLRIHGRIEDKKIIESNTSFFHELPFIGLDSSLIDVTLSDQSTLLILFSSECSVCEREASDIRRCIKNFASSEILMVSTEPLKKIDDFASSSGLKGYSEVTFAHIHPEVAYSYFGAYSVPSIFIYDEQRKLKKRFTGETKAETLLKYLDKE